MSLTVLRLSRGDFRDIVSDHGKLYLRTATVLEAEPESLRVILSEPLDKEFVEKIAGDLGRIAVYGNGSPAANSTAPALQYARSPFWLLKRRRASRRSRPERFRQRAARSITRCRSRSRCRWWIGPPGNGGATERYAEVETRPSVLYARLFAALGDFARGLEYILLSIAIVFAIIEMLALFVGTKLTRSITAAVDQLYEGDQAHQSSRLQPPDRR